jgi:hypothetical protein
MKTYGTVCGLTEHERRRIATPDVENRRTNPHLQALAELLTLLTEHTPFVWTHTVALGSAGFVHVEFDLDPCKLSTRDRDRLLSFAAKLTNWGAQ